jgi:hypothetical protein
VRFVAAGVEVLDRARRSATDLRDLAQQLGVIVLENEDVILDDLDKVPDSGELMERLRVATAQLDLDAWPGAVRTLKPELIAAIRKLSPTPELAALAFLQGLCTGNGPLDRFFAAAWGDLPLRRGDPFPVPPPPLNATLGRLSPNPMSTVRRQGPLTRVTDFEIHHDARWPTVLILRDKETLDAAAWVWTGDGDGAAARLPLVSVVFPCDVNGLQLPADEVTAAHWFGVWPKDGVWQLDDLTDTLRLARAKGCSIALLPEMTLPHPDALEAVVAEGAKKNEMPSLVVAGSAHVREQSEDGSTVRSNASMTYLNGAPLMRHRKLHPFRTADRTVLGEESAPGTRDEWLSTTGLVLQVAMGRRTRLAVLICADVLDSYVHEQLLHLQVNLVLVPSMTFDDAGFNGLSDIPNLNQGTVIIANAALAPFAVSCRIPDTTDDTAVWLPNGQVVPFGVVFDPIDLSGSIAIL